MNEGVRSEERRSAEKEGRTEMGGEQEQREVGRAG